jgi:hypothetical protein
MMIDNYLKELLLDFGPGATSNVLEDLQHSQHYLRDKTDLAYLFGIFESPDRSQVSGRIRQEFNTCQQQKCWKALKCQKEAPSDYRRSIIDEGKSKVFTSQP